MGVKKVVEGKNDLKTWCFNNGKTIILDEWDYEKNGSLPSEYSFSSGKSVWFKCASGHSYNSKISNRIRREIGCPYCKGIKVIIGVNDFVSWCKKNNNESLISEWSPQNNVRPEECKPFSNKVIKWICKFGHEWEASLPSRTRMNSGCPYCSGRRAIAGQTDLEAWCYVNNKMYLLEEWDFTKNVNKPNEVTTGTNQKVWWKCRLCGNEWRTSIGARTRGTNCSKCSKKEAMKFRTIKKIEYKGSLAGNYPQLVKEWDYAKNSITPEEVLAGSSQIVWWRCSVCEKGWESSITNRVKGQGCPECAKAKREKSHMKTILAKSQLLSESALPILEEWNTKRNGNMTPADYTISSGKKVWWICSICGFEWQQSIYYRTSSTSRCPQCAKRFHSSFPEQAIYFYVKKEFPDAVSGDRETIKPCELDIFIPSQNVAIEYDGVRYHKKSDKDNKKNKQCKEKGIHIYRIREQGCPELESLDNVTCYSLKASDFSDLQRIISDILQKLGRIVNIDLEADQIKIYNNYITNIIDNNLEQKYPTVAKEWDYVKNENLLPKMFSYASGAKIWWNCEEGHSYQSVISSRTIGGNGCPYCAKQKLLPGFNDFATCYPDIAKEWDYEKNGDLKPTDCIGGVQKVWWKCPKGHSYLMKMSSRTSKQRSGCTICAGKMISPGENDLEFLFPQIAKEWDYNKNTLHPYEVLPGSSKMVWWICDIGHSYQSRVSSRVIQGTGCPICAGRRILPGYNDLASKFPELLEEWDYQENAKIGLDPAKVLATSGKKAWWKCLYGHSYYTRIYSKTRLRTGCPYCIREKVSKG